MVFNVNIDEELKAKEYLFLTNDAQANILKQMKAESTCYPTFFNLVIKYLLLSEKKSPEEVEKIIFNYSLVFSSLILYKNNVELNPFYKLIKNGIQDLNDLINLKLTKDCAYKEILDNRKYDSQFSNKKKKDDSVNKSNINNDDTDKKVNSSDIQNEIVHKILVNTIDYFIPRNNLFSSFENRNKKPFDLLIAEIIHNENKFIKYSFNIDKDNYDLVKANIKSTHVGDNIALLSFFIHNMFENNNLDYKLPIATKNKIYYQILANASEKMKTSSIQFIKSDVNMKYIIVPDKDFTEFIFTYNDEKYIMTKKFIKILK